MPTWILVLVFLIVTVQHVCFEIKQPSKSFAIGTAMMAFTLGLFVAMWIYESLS